MNKHETCKLYGDIKLPNSSGIGDLQQGYEAIDPIKVINP